MERERDELLALLDIQERERYEMLRSQSLTAEEQAYQEYSSSEVDISVSGILVVSGVCLTIANIHPWCLQIVVQIQWSRQLGECGPTLQGPILSQALLLN